MIYCLLIVHNLNDFKWLICNCLFIRKRTSTQVEPPPVEERPSRDDESVEEESANHDELLAKHLGAELIAEED